MHIKTAEAARRAGVSRGTIHNLIKRQPPPFKVVRVGIQLLIDETSFNQWLATATIPGSDEHDDRKGDDLDRLLKMNVLMIGPVPQLLVMLKAFRKQLSEILDLEQLGPAFSFMPLMSLAVAGDISRPLDDAGERPMILEIARMVADEYPTVADALARVA